MAQQLQIFNLLLLVIDFAVLTNHSLF